jgi:prepilin-type N-terminal cleavage/methylation domain-containing protein
MIHAAQMQNKKINSGYTLIELLVGLMIVGILFSMGYANFRDFTRRQTLLDVTKKMEADLRSAQQMALSGQVPNTPNCTGTNRLQGYNFRVVSANNYEIRASCTGGVAPTAIKNVILPPSVSFANPFPNPNPILFKVLGNGTNIGNSNARIRLRQTGNTNIVTLTISAGGQIQ